MITYVENKNTSYLNHSVMYQLFLRSFTPEGTISAAKEKLPHLKELGVDIIYFCPCFGTDPDDSIEHWSNRQRYSKLGNPKNPYRISDYFVIDEEYGTTEDLKSFVKEAHDLGMKVALDLVYYHCGPSAVFLDEHPEFVIHKEDGSIEMGEWHFPRLNFESPSLREYLWENMCYYVRECDIDGYRCDVGDHVPLDFWAEGTRRIREIKPHAFMLNEGVHPEWLGVFDLNYESGWGETLFKSFMSDYKEVKLTRDGDIEWTKLEPDEKTEWDASCPEKYYSERLEFYKSKHIHSYRVIRGMDNHDTVNNEYDKRKETFTPPAVMTAAYAFCMLIDGVPFIYNGEEIADCARHSIFSNAQHGGLGIDWSKKDTVVGKKRYEDMKKLIEIRHTVPETAEGVTSWLKSSKPTEATAFARTLDGFSTVVLANFTANTLDVAFECPSAKSICELFSSGAKVSYRDGKLVCTLSPYASGVVRLEL